MGEARPQQTVVEQGMQDIFLTAEGGGIGEDGSEQFVADVHVEPLWVVVLDDVPFWFGVVGWDALSTSIRKS